MMNELFNRKTYKINYKYNIIYNAFERMMMNEQTNESEVSPLNNNNLITTEI